jgi:hypothetical protein
MIATNRHFIHGRPTQKPTKFLKLFFSHGLTANYAKGANWEKIICASFAYLACYAVKSGGGPPHSKTLARSPAAPEPRGASWSAPVLWRFGKAAGSGLAPATKLGEEIKLRRNGMGREYVAPAELNSF